MLKLRGCQQALYGYVNVLSINESSMQPQLLPGTLTFLVCEDDGSLKGVLALKRAVKFRTFLCSWRRIRGFRPPKCMETS